MANACACGCGEFLPEGSTRLYKRGHKNRDINEVPDTGFTEASTIEDVEPGLDESFSIDDAASQTPNDPEPKDQPEFKPRTTIKITAALRRDVEGKLAFAMALGGQVWVLADPICGSTFVDNSPNIAHKLTPIVCQSPDLVKWLTKSSNFILYIDLFMACWPVLQMMFAHHIAKSVVLSASPNGQVPAQPATSDYVVQ